MYEHLIKDSRRFYWDYIEVGDKYAVCWYADLLDIVDSSSLENNDKRDKRIYRIEADDKYDAVRKFLLQKFLETKEIDTSESKENCIKTIIESTLKNGRMKCLKSDPVLDDLSYEIETVIEGEYYTIEEDNSDEDMARVEAIMKNINYSDALEHLSNQVFADVYVEAHLYDVAVMGLSHIPLAPGCSSSSAMRDRMPNYYFVSFRDSIENRINDEDIFFDGVDMNEDIDTVFEAFADSEDDAKKQFLRLSAEYTYEKQNRLELIKRECAARVIRRIVAGEIMRLPREVLACESIGQILTKVYDVVAKLQSASRSGYSKKEFREMAREIELDDFVNLLDRESVMLAPSLHDF